MKNLLFLKRQRSPLTNELTSTVSGARLDNAFNPCYSPFQNKSYITIRAKSPDNNPARFDAFLIVIDHSNGSTKTTNLSAHFREQGIETIADPKLFHREGTLWVTFNTGWSPVENQIYICKIAPSLDTPLLCRYSGRSRIEKNWAFFDYKGKLHALYGLSPIMFLSAEDQRKGGSIFFNRSKSISTGNFPEDINLSIGTQICTYGDTHHLIAHQKINLFGQRAYTGVPIRFKINDGLSEFEKSRHRLNHSPISLLGSSIKHNKNLFSCTYFSGLHIHAGVATLSYGVNDIQSNFSSIRLEQIW